MGVLLWIFTILFLTLSVIPILDGILNISNNSDASNSNEENSTETDVENVEDLPDDFAETRATLPPDEPSGSDKTHSEPSKKNGLRHHVKSESESDEGSVPNELQGELDLSEENPPEPERPQWSTDEENGFPFEPIHTFLPEENQTSSTNGEQSEPLWSESNPEKRSKYNDLANPDQSSEELHKAIEWLEKASTEAIHIKEEFQRLLNYFVPYIETPRAHGAKLVTAQSWREQNASISRLIGERLLVMAFALSAHGPRKMPQHEEARAELLKTTWNDDGLEKPLLYQAIGRLGVLTPTPLDTIQPMLCNRIEGLIPRKRDPSQWELASFHGLLLAVCTGPDYPLQYSDDNLPRTWHWDGNTPPYARWDEMLPFLYCLWIYHWTQDTPGSAVQDIGAMLGSWWEENPPGQDFFDENPDTWEGILMFLWATAPTQQHVWNQLRERYEQLSIDDENLRKMTNTYFEWSREYREEGAPPEIAFSGSQLPPIEWIRPLPAEFLSKFSQPSFDFPKSWIRQLNRMDPPETEELRPPF